MANTEYIIAIPSYKRPSIILKTLNLLKKHNIPNDRIIIFLKNQTEVNSYKDVILNYKIIMTEAEGIMETRNYLQCYFYYQTDVKNVLFIDDDMNEIMDYDKPIEDLDSFIKYAFKETEELNLNLWGVSPFHNTFFLKKKISTNLKYICGAFFGQIFDREKDLILSDIDHGEDFQFSIEMFNRDGGVVRFNWVALVTKYFGDGGINESLGGLDNRKIQMEQNCKWLAYQYPSACRLIEKKYGYDIRLKHGYKILTK
tara:strand:- start:3360 stop:4127 length:768 start_codon:yes stop_codon:yes gene_type:complete